MQRTILATALGLLIGCLAIIDDFSSRGHQAAAATSQTKPAARALQPNTLCARDERVIFACVLRRPAKIVSVCASKDLTREGGYLQYRFGLPAKIELEYPKDRAGTQGKFAYTHYFRAQVDLNEISFSIDGADYAIVDDYNGEEKPPQSLEGLTINWPNTNRKEVRYACRTKPNSDYTDLQAVLDEATNPSSEILAFFRSFGLVSAASTGWSQSLAIRRFVRASALNIERTQMPWRKIQEDY